MDDLKSATHNFLSGVDFSKDRVAIVSFNNTAAIKVSLTSDNSILDAAVDALFPAGLTNYEAALAKAQDEIRAHGRPEAEPVVIMITDGRQTTGGDPMPIANDLKSNLGVQVYAMGLQIVEWSDMQKLKDIASDPDYVYYRQVVTSGELAAVYISILRDIQCDPG
jgi:Mg-chelatase subunit ChlD